MTKVAIKNENITSFGGIYHIMDVFSKLGFEKLTESVLGRRGCSGKAFSHGSILGSLFFSYLCGGDCLEDINALIGQFRQRPGTLLPGADTVGRGLKELAEENIVYKSETSVRSYSFNTAEKLNTLLLRMIRRMGLIKGSSIKCVDVFRIALTEEAMLCVKQKHSQDGLGYLLYYHPPMQKTFSCKYFENADNRLKNHDIILGKAPTDKGKNTHKKQVCNQK